MCAAAESSIVQSKDLQWWFFCEKKPGPTQQRSTKGGFWKKTGRTTDVNSRYGGKQPIGCKNYFTFFRGTSKNSTKTDWVMHEFQLTSNALNGLPEFNVRFPSSLLYFPFIRNTLKFMIVAQSA